eukprot:2098553-Prymnesium_polylepis.1
MRAKSFATTTVRSAEPLTSQPACGWYASPSRLVTGTWSESRMNGMMWTRNASYGAAAVEAKVAMRTLAFSAARRTAVARSGRPGVRLHRWVGVATRQTFDEGNVASKHGARRRAAMARAGHVAHA